MAAKNLTYSNQVVKATIRELLKIAAATFLPGGAVVVAGADALYKAYQQAVFDKFKVPSNERAELQAWLSE